MARSHRFPHSRVMKSHRPTRIAFLLCFALLAFVVAPASGITLTNPIVFVTQPPIPRELNSSISNTFLSVVTIFGNQQADTAHAARGGDLWLMTTNQGLVNLTRKGGYGTNGVQHGSGIGVRDPQIHWSGKKVLFSMVVGAPTGSNDLTKFFWQLYEVTNLDAVISNTNTTPAIVLVTNQPSNYNNVTPCYATDGRIIFMSDRPFNGVLHLNPELDEYKGNPTVSGTYSLNPVNGDLKMLEHTPSGAFNPFIDSFGRLILTRWDHLTQDPVATDDRLSRGTNGSFNFATEAINAFTSTNTLETFPEPRNFDTNYTAQLGVNGNSFNLFLPWQLDQDGGNEEVLNHVGRHELSLAMSKSFTADTNLVTFSNLASRAASGVTSANTNNLAAFFQITEDPRTNGLYWGVSAQDISILGGNHSAGQILTLNGGPNVNPTNMIANNITATSGANGPNSFGLFRNPLPMSDGTLISVFTDTVNNGWDTNIGTASMPLSKFHFRLYTMVPSGILWTTNLTLTGGGIQNTSIYCDGAMLVTNSATMWELQPVEVRARPIPTPLKSSVGPIEQQVFIDEQVDLLTFQADLAARNLALSISRDVTARDVADKQQPYNLRVPGGTNSIPNTGKTYDITHLQFFQADYLRGYTYGTTNIQPGRRILATPMHDTAAFNYLSKKTNAPIGGTELMSDGSQATIVPANRAMTWHLTGTNNNDSVVKERYWISFRPGEIRTCANCHGINDKDQIGRPSPSNPPQALREFLRFWRTNAASAYALTVNNGTGGGSFGAGSIVSLTANPPASGTAFLRWSGATVSNTLSSVTTFVMPTNSAIVTAVYTNLPSPLITSFALTGGGTNISVSAQGYANQAWILQGTIDLVNWTNINTNNASQVGNVQFTIPILSGTPQSFYRIEAP
ncbi:MAG: hypothetical protein JWM68_3028 [Verrucomicrobiales bacterium]|nr:hypothetical protein [Verrucomicrobiales bacterium]